MDDACPAPCHVVGLLRQSSFGYEGCTSAKTGSLDVGGDDE
jgi:hypothetical protein